MSALSSIEWTDRTWNPVRGCSIVSPGCVNCYAMKFAHRFSGHGKPYEGLTKQTKAGPQWTGKVTLVEDALTEPLKWRKPQRVFVNSMSDLFHDGVSDEFISLVFAVMAMAPQHTFQILTKRPERMRAYLDEMSSDPDAYCFAWARESFPDTDQVPDEIWPLPNVWLGVSCEDQQRAGERIPLLLQTPAAVRFVSAEPLLGPIDFTALKQPNGDDGFYYADALSGGCFDFGYDGLRSSGDGPTWFENTIDWVIVGGESGAGARPCDVAWVRALVQQCKASSVACFVKQFGSVPVMNGPEWAKLQPLPMLSARNSKHGTEDRVPLALGSSKGGDPSEWPEDLRVRQFPATEARY